MERNGVWLFLTGETITAKSFQRRCRRGGLPWTPALSMVQERDGARAARSAPHPERWKPAGRHPTFPTPTPEPVWTMFCTVPGMVPGRTESTGPACGFVFPQLSPSLPCPPFTGLLGSGPQETTWAVEEPLREHWLPPEDRGCVWEVLRVDR